MLQLRTYYLLATIKDYYIDDSFMKTYSITLFLYRVLGNYQFLNLSKNPSISMTSNFSFRLSSFLGKTILFIFVVITCSCTALLTNTIIDPAVSNLQKQQDVDLVCEGAASYLLMIDSLIESNPDSRDLLLVGSKAYSGSVAAFVSCGASPARIKTISTKAQQYGKRLLATLIQTDKSQNIKTSTNLDSLNSKDSEYLFWGVFGWLSWVQQEEGSPGSMADLIVIEKLMAKLLELDDTIENGSPHVFFGALYGR